ncbi:MAG: Fe-S cluster assembly scaffold IscU [Myxococcota bacterium]|nr:Fe-S cluster assembly scaffold IscU [Myxococcota bacterium]MEC9389061.1 Fe-S cluster assembly scaffold IscU [Myxococcota bacterium]
MGYSEKVIDHLENPRNVGSLDRNDPDVGTGMVGAPACGDVMKLQLKINDNGIIEDAKFKTFGCGSAIASSSLITTMVKGQSIDDALAISNAEIAKELALPPVKIHCSVLAEDAIKAAINDYQTKKNSE